jgi:hypothetical protein
VLDVEHELGELGECVQAVADDAGLVPISTVVRRTDSGMVMTP